MEPKIVILTGPPGSGKSTIARRLANDSKTPSVHLHTDDFYHFIVQGRIEPFLPEAHLQNITVINVIVQAACSYADGGYFVIVDGIIGHWFLDPFCKACSSKNILLGLYNISAQLRYRIRKSNQTGKRLKG